MPLRNRNGKWEWRFKVDGHEWSHITDLDATERNRTKAQRLEAEAHRLVIEGRGEELGISVQPFTSAAEAFEKWAEGEYCPHPNTWKRLRGSMTSAKVFFGKKPLSGVTRGDLQDYKSWRRRTHKVREVTLRHDLHALSLLFQYGQQHQWCKRNVVDEIDIPSDKDAVRINVLSVAQEQAYFTACEVLRLEKIAGKRTKEARGLQNMADLHTLMLLQGCRPEELRSLEWANVDLERGEFTIAAGKSDAAKRTLKMRAEARSIFARRVNESRWVFPGNRGKHMGPAQRLHAAVLKRAKINCVPYDFRHTFATRAVERGIDLPTLAAILGHANLRSIMKYVHLKQTHMDAALSILDQPLPAVCPLSAGENGEETGKPGNLREDKKTNGIM